MQLNYWDDSWPLMAEICPCDVHFVEYLQANQVRDSVVFHFGTGEHHTLGVHNVEAGEANEILAITASPREYDEYVKLVIENPSAARTYKVIFGDIYTLTPRIIPDFDMVTLFHLCEYYDAERSAYAQHDDYSLLALFVSKLKPGGKIFFYSMSTHFDSARAIIEEFVERGELVLLDVYKTLLAYGRP
jgi:hypothetical protein